MVDWGAWEDVGSFVDAAGGAAFIALGITVAMLRPRTRVSVAFAAFAIAFGLRFVWNNLIHPLFLADRPLWWDTLTDGVLLSASAVSLVLLAAWFPQRSTTAQRRAIGALAAVTALVVIGLVAWMSWGVAQNRAGWLAATSAGDADARAWVVVLDRTMVPMFVAGATVFLGTMALRFATADHVHRTSIALAAAGIGAWPMWAAGLEIVRAVHESAVGQALGQATLVDNNVTFGILAFVTIALWIRTAVGLHGDAARTAWRLTHWFLGLMLLGALVRSVVPVLVPAQDLGVAGALRAAGVAILAYAILKHQLFDVDVRIQWALSKTTIGAIFIAVFFVVSEGAAAIFSNAWGTGFGILAAALLVFAIAPLQRLGDRLASAAMSNVKPVAGGTDDERAEFYRGLAKDVWADGTIGKKERAVLDNAARRLDLPDDVAMRIERQAARGE